MKAYRKLIVAIVGVSAMLITRYVWIDSTPIIPQIVEAIIGALMTFGIWKAENE